MTELNSTGQRVKECHRMFQWIVKQITRTLRPGSSPPSTTRPQPVPQRREAGGQGQGDTQSSGSHHWMGRMGESTKAGYLVAQAAKATYFFGSNPRVWLGFVLGVRRFGLENHHLFDIAIWWGSQKDLNGSGTKIGTGITVFFTRMIYFHT